MAPTSFQLLTDWRLNMQLAAFTDEINRDDPLRALQLASRWQIPAVEIRLLPGGRFPNVPDAVLQETRLMINDAGRTVSGVSPGLFKCAWDDDEVETGIAETLPRACEWALNFGTDIVSVFGFGRGDAVHGLSGFSSSISDRLERMCAVASAAGCRLVLENEAVCWGDTGTEAAALIRAVGEDRLSMCWDPGNAARAGCAAPFDEYADLADLVTHVHLKNFDPATGAWSLMDTGVVDWPAQFRALADNGYAGHIVIETHTSTEPDGTAPVIDAGEHLAPLEANSFRNLQYVRSLLG